MKGCYRPYLGKAERSLLRAAGILYFRSSPGAQQFLGSWDAALQGGSNVTEQTAFNAVVRRGMRPLKTHAGNYRVFYGMDGRATFGVLPLAGFLNGHGYFVQRLHEVRQLLLGLSNKNLRRPDTHLRSSWLAVICTAAPIACCCWGGPLMATPAFCNTSMMCTLQPTMISAANTVAHWLASVEAQ